MALMGMGDKILLQRGRVLMQLTSTNLFGQPTFAYLLTSQAEMEQLQRDMESRPFVNYADYGEMVLLGEGEPTEADFEEAMQLAGLR
jgi:hypothetical protein